MNQATEIEFSTENVDDVKATPPQRFQDRIGLSDADAEAIYTVAHGMYKQEKLEDAETFFRYLCICDSSSERYWLALGMTRQKRENYPGAYDAYVMAGSAEGNSPRPPLFAAECALQFGQIAWAQSALLEALDLADNDHDPDSIRNRIAALQFGLNQQLEAQEEK